MDVSDYKHRTESKPYETYKYNSGFRNGSVYGLTHNSTTS